MSDSCDPMDCCPPSSSVNGISQARILEWLAIFFSKGSFRPRDLPDLGIEPASPVWQAGSLPLSHLGTQCIILGPCSFLSFVTSSATFLSPSLLLCSRLSLYSTTGDPTHSCGFSYLKHACDFQISSPHFCEF